jgi:hypothetical protein
MAKSHLALVTPATVIGTVEPHRRPYVAMAVPVGPGGFDEAVDFGALTGYETPFPAEHCPDSP